MRSIKWSKNSAGSYTGYKTVYGGKIALFNLAQQNSMLWVLTHKTSKAVLKCRTAEAAKALAEGYP